MILTGEAQLGCIFLSSTGLSGKWGPRKFLGQCRSPSSEAWWLWGSFYCPGGEDHSKKWVLVWTLASFFFFFFLIFNWRIIALQCCAGFCLTTMWISHKYTYIPFLLNLLPTPTNSQTSRLSQSTGLNSLCYTCLIDYQSSDMRVFFKRENIQKNNHTHFYQHISYATKHI